MLELLTRKAACPRGRSSDVELLVRITPPRSLNRQRTPLNLGLVLDRSGSMKGDKWEMTLEATRQVIAALKPCDHLSLVHFSTEAEVLFESQAALDPQGLSERLHGLSAEGGTHLAEGLWLGGKQVLASARPERISRLIVMTDGEANHGETRPDVLCERVQQLCDQGVQTTTLGIGASYSEALLRSLARSGQGNHFFIQHHGEVVDFFDLELSSLMATLGTEVRLKLQVAAGINMEWLADVDLARDGSCRLANLVKGQELTLACRLVVPASVDTAQLLQAQLSWHCPLQSGRVSTEVSLGLPRVTSREWERLPSDALVQEAVALGESTRESQRALACLKRGETQVALLILEQAQKLPGIPQAEQQRLQELQDTIRQGDHNRGHKMAAMHGHGHGSGHARFYGQHRGRADDLEEALNGLPIPAFANRSSDPRKLPWTKVEGMLRGHFYGERLARGARAPLGEGAALSLATLRYCQQPGNFDPLELARQLQQVPLLHPTSSQQKFRQRWRDGVRDLASLGSASAGCAGLRRICPLLVPAAAGRPGHLWEQVAAATLLTHNDSLALAAALGYARLLWELLHLDSPPEPRWYRQQFRSAIEKIPTQRYRGQGRGVRDWQGSMLDFLDGPMAHASIHDWDAGRAMACWGSGAYLLEVLPCALYLLERHGHEPEQALRLAIHNTHEADTLAMLVGAALGALHGPDLGWYLKDELELALEETRDRLGRHSPLTIR